MKTLFVAYIRTHFRALASQAEWLKRAGHEVVFYFGTKYQGWSEDAKVATGLGLTAVAFDGCEVGKSERTLWHGRKEPTAFPARSYVGCLLKFRALKQFYHALFSKLTPDFIILPEENVGYLTQFLAKQGQACGAGVVVMPYTIDNPIETAEAHLQNTACIVRGGLRRLFSEKYPYWMFEHKGVRLLRLPLPAVVVMQCMGYAPAKPWQNLCSFADAVTVECEALYSQHLVAGLDLMRLRVTGSCTLDKLAAVKRDSVAMRSALLAELGIDPAMPVFLAAIPPDIFQSKQRKVEFTNHAEVVAFWINVLAATGWNVVVNLHPHLKPELITLGAHPNVRLCQRPVAELLPLCDVFVACISATIRWAIAAAKPVLNHDLYRYGYDDYRSAPGVVHVTTRDEFNREVMRIAGDAAYREQLTLAQASVAADWGVLDGKSSERLLAIFSELKHSNQAPTI